MSIVLDPQTEQRIQRKAEQCGYTRPAQLINHALDILDSEDSWTEEDKAELDQHLAQSMAEIARGEGIPGNQVREVLARMRSARSE